MIPFRASPVAFSNQWLFWYRLVVSVLVLSTQVSGRRSAGQIEEILHFGARSKKNLMNFISSNASKNVPKNSCIFRYFQCSRGSVMWICNRWKCNENFRNSVFKRTAVKVLCKFFSLFWCRRSTSDWSLPAKTLCQGPKVAGGSCASKQEGVVVCLCVKKDCILILTLQEPLPASQGSWGTFCKSFYYYDA